MRERERNKNKKMKKNSYNLGEFFHKKKIFSFLSITNLILLFKY